MSAAGNVFVSIDTTPPIGSIWVHGSTNRKVKVCFQPDWYAKVRAFPEPMVWYKAFHTPNGGHTALTKTTRERFLKHYTRIPDSPSDTDGSACRWGAPTAVWCSDNDGHWKPMPIAMPSPVSWPQPINTSTLHTLALVIRARASAICGDSYRRGDPKSTELLTRAMDEIAEAIDEIAGEASFTIERSAFLGWTVEKLLLHCAVAKSGEEARGHLAAGEVYLDGQRVTEDAPITTVTRERFTVRCGEKSAVVRVVG